jgi:hypothetical protein
MLRKFLTTSIAIGTIISTAIAQTNSSNTIGHDSAITSNNEVAEEAKPSPVITGSVDAYYRYNFANSKTTANNLTSFTNSQNSFELGMASVKLEHSIGKVGMVADLGFGKRAEEFSYNDENTRFAIKQLYASYSPWKNTKFTAGSWATHVGYEVVDAYANKNYSMSYMFSYGPFFHTGLKAEYTAGKSGFMLGIANPTDFKTANFSKKYVVAQYSVATKNDKLKAYLNFLGGKATDSSKNSQLDLVLLGTVSSKFSIGYNGTVASFKQKVGSKFGDSDSWWGSAVYLNVDPVSWLGLTLRTEYFSDKKLQTAVFTDINDGGNIFANTLSANFKIDNLIIIPELRYEHSSEELYFKSSGAGTQSTASFLVAAIYKF